MALFSQRLTRPSLYDQPMITIQRLAFEVLPFFPSADDYDIDAHTFSAYGTSTDGVLYLRRPKRLVVSKSKRPRKVILRKAWPDPSNAQEVALFHQKHLASRHDTLQPIYKCLPQSVNDTLTADSFTVKTNCLITSEKTIITSSHIPRCVIPPRSRFSRGVNEA